MNQGNQNNNLDGSVNFPLKRKRGRPRKYPRTNFEENVRPRYQNLQSGQNAQVPPGFERVNGNPLRQRLPIVNANDFVVGQVVSGVIEAAFDAGYLISVRAGKPNNVLRGAIFKPGRVVPINVENDVAPNLPMIPRNKVPFPPGNNSQFQGQNIQSFERNKQHGNIQRNETHPPNGLPAVNQVPRVAASSSNLLASKGKKLALTAEQTGHPVARGNVVPVVLQPVKTMYEVPVSSQSLQVAIQASDALTTELTTKGKEVQGADPPASRSTATSNFPTVVDQAPHSQSQTSQAMLPKDMQNISVSLFQPLAEALGEEETRSMKLPPLPFKELLTEVIKRIQPPSETPEIHTGNSKSGGKTSVKESCLRQEDKANDMDQPMLVKPLQALLPNHTELPISASRPLVLQDNTT
ncbi:putative AT hook motif-containing protein [Quillaja saponaria]|uniref:AT hook motif-containing protein n=1 Tax=Quillaja saponaria TaxID=32244 RepID=A0AAD7PML8_QUISA|nr:putative AT hook motif-containing protein [Quillaja saponaria]